jgi:hypothetical protein
LKNFKSTSFNNQNPTNAFKENKIRNKGIDIFNAKKIRPVAIAAIKKSENISVKF